jgi:hypothetical protein
VLRRRALEAVRRLAQPVRLVVQDAEREELVWRPRVVKILRWLPCARARMPIEGLGAAIWIGVARCEILLLLLWLMVLVFLGWSGGPSRGRTPRW